MTALSLCHRRGTCGHPRLRRVLVPYRPAGGCRLAQAGATDMAGGSDQTRE
jgi:hypothetical protein